MSSDYSSLPMSDTIESLESKIDSLNTNVDDLQDDITDLESQLALFKWLYKPHDTETVYTDSGTGTIMNTWEEIITYTIPSNIHSESTFDLSVRAGNDACDPGTYGVRVKINDDDYLIDESWGALGASNTYTEDDVNLVSDDVIHISVYASNGHSRKCELDFFKLFAERTGQWADIDLPTDWS